MPLEQPSTRGGGGKPKPQAPPLSGGNAQKQVLQFPRAPSRLQPQLLAVITSQVCTGFFPFPSHFSDLLRSGNFQTHQVRSTRGWAQSNPNGTFVTGCGHIGRLRVSEVNRKTRSPHDLFLLPPCLSQLTRQLCGASL